MPLETRIFLETTKVIRHFINIFKYSLMYSNFFEIQKFTTHLTTACVQPLPWLKQTCLWGGGGLFNADRLLDVSTIINH